MILFALALALLDVVLAAPDRFLGRPTLAFAVELPLILAALWLLPMRWRRSACVGLALLMLLALALRGANTATLLAFDRPFDAGMDLALAPAGWDLLVRSHGWLIALGVAGVAVMACAALGLLLTAALRRVAALGGTRNALIALGVAALMAMVPGRATQFATAALIADQARTVVAGVRETAAFRVSLASDPLRGIADDHLYTALRGHDVLVVFVESYGRVALDDPGYAAIDRQLDRITQHLTAAGIGSRSAWFTSPTFGGESWFAHSTLMSGLWADDQRRTDALVQSTHPTMIGDFRRAGWRTVVVMPEIDKDWPAGKYLAPDAIYDAPGLHFAGMPLGYVTMPDQYTLAVLQQKELSAEARPPVMAEIALVSSHAPWTPLPKLVAWNDVGDGSVFNQARVGDAPEMVWANPDAVRRQYGQSISYDLSTLESFVLTYATDRTVLIVLGDHQPMSFISGEDATRDVPVHIIARDPQVLAALNDWHWTEGMRPDAASPEWRMDALRERLAHAFSAGP